MYPISSKIRLFKGGHFMVQKEAKETKITKRAWIVIALLILINGYQ